MIAVDESEVMAKVTQAIRDVLEEFRLGVVDETWASGGVIELDSVEAVALLIRLEQDFGIKVEDWELAERPLKTLNDVAAFIRSKLSASGGGAEGAL
jgi:acyl carrier protein